MVEQAPDSDLYVLPEMWSTGFATSPEGIADETGEALSWMRHAAEQTGAAFCGSVAVKTSTHEGGEFRNRHYFVRPDGSFEQYDKHHLFIYGGEDRCYQRGEERIVAKWEGWRFLLLTCYDLRFPIWARYQGDYDAIIVIANWPDKRQYAWNTLTRARAIENQCYLIACNRVGDDGDCHYIGQSMILDSKGMPIAESTTSGPDIVSAELSLEEQNRFRNKFRVLEERDNKLPK